MAYAAAITITKIGPRSYSVAIAETEAASGSEATITLPFRAGVVLSQRGVLSSGTGTTIDPQLGTASGLSTGDHRLLMEHGTAAASVNNVPTNGIGAPFFVANGKLYHKSVPNDATADHVIATEYLIREGF